MLCVVGVGVTVAEAAEKSGGLQIARRLPVHTNNFEKKQKQTAMAQCVLLRKNPKDGGIVGTNPLGEGRGTNPENGDRG